MDADARSETTYQDRYPPARNGRWGASDEPPTDTEDTAPAGPPPPKRYRPSPPIPAGAGAGANLGRSGTIGGFSTRSSGLENLHPGMSVATWTTFRES